MGERLTRKEAMVLLGHDPKNQAGISQLVKTGQLTPYMGIKKDPHQRGRKRIMYFDRDEIDAILRGRAQAKVENTSPRVQQYGSGRQGVVIVSDQQRHEESRLIKEAFDRETVNDAQARALLGVGAWELLQLVMSKQIRTRKMMGEERYERDDVIKEQARRDLRRQSKQ